MRETFQQTGAATRHARMGGWLWGSPGSDIPKTSSPAARQAHSGAGDLSQCDDTQTTTTRRIRLQDYVTTAADQRR